MFEEALLKKQNKANGNQKSLPQLRGFDFDLSSPQGAHYVLLNIREYGFYDDHEFCQWLTRAIGLTGIEPVKVALAVRR